MKQAEEGFFFFRRLVLGKQELIDTPYESVQV